MHGPGRWATVPDRHLQRVDDQLGADVVGHRPAHDAAAEAVDDHRQVKPPLTGAVLGHVGDVEPVRLGGVEPPLDQVSRGCRGLITARAAAQPPPVHALQAGVPH